MIQWIIEFRSKDSEIWGVHSKYENKICCETAHFKLHLDETSNDYRIISPLIQALQILEAESIGDMVYDIRAEEQEDWDGPRVIAWSNACQIIKEYLDGHV